jgi:BMFP domain-containing protein YqiC
MSGENLSEEFVTKAATIFEAAVVARAEEVIAEAETQLMEQFEKAIEEVKEDLAAKVDDYLNYMVEEWMKDNEIAIEKGLRAEITEDFINGLRNLFVEHYIDIPADKVEVVEELTAKVEELEASLNEQIKSGIELKKELSEQKKIEAIYTACEGLTQTQVEKLKSLAEGVEFTTEEEFGEKLSTLKESYFKAEVKVATASDLDDEVQIEEETKTVKGTGDALIESYAKTISQTLVK